ncbi:MAG: sulfite exporter TauE/SafE family protein [Pseudomonadales bacterium]|nr:sulfite exporter TauE/SafE family protein [Pseudomonadales bacterium]
MSILLYLFIGSIAGLLAGLFGVGGGVVIVPVLIFVFRDQGFSEQILTHMAVGTSLATIIITSFSSVYQHHQSGAVQWRLFLLMAIGICVGVLFGAKAVQLMPGNVLQLAFGAFLVLIALQMAFGFQPKAAGTSHGKPLLVGSGGVIGFFSAMFGIGGGSLSVPFLTWRGIAMQKAVATSAACGLPIAIVGAGANIVNGWGHPALPSNSTGFVYWPAFFGVVITSTIVANWSAKLAHRVPQQLLKRLFGGLLLLVGLQFLIRNSF